MFIACLFYTWSLCGDHAHSVCVEHDMDVADYHIAYGYANLEVRLAPVVMVIKYEVMLLCFCSLTSILLLIERIVEKVLECHANMQMTKKGKEVFENVKDSSTLQ
jgi:hypothetical protein